MSIRNERNQICKRQPLNYSLLTWDRHIHTECGGVKHVNEIPTLPITWDSGITVQHKNIFTLSKLSLHQLTAFEYTSVVELTCLYLSVLKSDCRVLFVYSFFTLFFFFFFFIFICNVFIVPIDLNRGLQSCSSDSLYNHLFFFRKKGTAPSPGYSLMFSYSVKLDVLLIFFRDSFLYSIHRSFLFPVFFTTQFFYFVHYFLYLCTNYSLLFFSDSLFLKLRPIYMQIQGVGWGLGARPLLWEKWCWFNRESLNWTLVYLSIFIFPHSVTTLTITCRCMQFTI